MQNGRLDILAANRSVELSTPRSTTMRLARAASVGSPNHARYTFLNPGAPDFYPDWNRAAADTVALLRAEAGRNPADRELTELTELIGDLTTRSDRFSALWATHNVRWHTTGTKRFHHHVVGDLALGYEGLELAGDAGQTLITFTAQPGSLSQEALQFLANWADVPEHAPADGTTSEQHTPEGGRWAQTSLDERVPARTPHRRVCLAVAGEC